MCGLPRLARLVAGSVRFVPGLGPIFFGQPLLAGPGLELAFRLRRRPRAAGSPIAPEALH